MCFLMHFFYAERVAFRVFSDYPVKKYLLAFSFSLSNLLLSIRDIALVVNGRTNDNGR